MKKKIQALIVWAGAMCAVGAEETVRLNDVVNNTKKSGTFLLDQGYRGKFPQTICDPKESPNSPEVFEFSHGMLKLVPVDSKVPSIQRIAVVSIMDDAEARTFLIHKDAIYCDKLPEFQILSDFATVEDFEGLFGFSKEFVPAWSFDGEVAYSDRTWTGFKTQPDGSIRVVDINLTVGKSSVGTKITKKCIREGIFYATGKPPVLVPPAGRDVEQPADGKTPKAPRTPH